MGTGSYQTKAFDWLVTLEEGSLEWPEVRLAFFNPQSGRYESTTAPAVRLERAETPEQTSLENAFFAHSPQALGPPRYLLTERLTFWWLQALLALAWVAMALRSALLQLLAWHRNHPLTPVRQRWKAWLKQPPAETDRFLAQAEALLFDALCAQARRPLRTQREAVAFAHQRWGAAVAEPVASFFRALERSRFSPERPAPPARQSTLATLAAVRNRLLTS